MLSHDTFSESLEEVGGEDRPDPPIAPRALDEGNEHDEEMLALEDGLPPEEPLAPAEVQEKVLIDDFCGAVLDRYEFFSVPAYSANPGDFDVFCVYQLLSKTAADKLVASCTADEVSKEEWLVQRLDYLIDGSVPSTWHTPGSLKVF